MREELFKSTENQKNMKSKKFSRQFIMSLAPSDKFHGFQEDSFCGYYIYVHSLLSFTKVDTKNVKALLLGYIIDPHHPHWQDEDILLHICNNTQTVDDVPNLLYPLSGRFALFVVINEQLFVFHDPCGFRTVTYAKTDEGLIFGSDEQIICEVTALKKGEKFGEYEKSELKKAFENYIVAGVSLYEDVYKLVANHYLKVDTLTQIRYFPNKKIVKTTDIESVSDKSIEILIAEFSALKNRMHSFAFTVTAGRDSRLLMAFIDNSCKDVFYYTMSYWNVVNNHPDLRVPAEILKKRKLQHHILDCTCPSPVDFKEVYMKSSTMAHPEWCDIAYGLDKCYPEERLNVKGVASEIACCHYYSKGKKLMTDFVNHYTEFVDKMGESLEGLLELSFNKKALKVWFEGVKNVQDNFAVSPFDLYLWEQRMSSWQAQSQLEWDITQETYAPFNNRELFDTMLALNNDCRIRKNNKLYKIIIEKQLPLLLEFSYDGGITSKLVQNTKRIIRKTLQRLGINTLRFRPRWKKQYRKEH